MKKKHNKDQNVLIAQLCLHKHTHHTHGHPHTKSHIVNDFVL